MYSLLLAQLFSLFWTFTKACFQIVLDLPKSLLKNLGALKITIPSGGVEFYEGVVTHSRRKPMKNSFKYEVRVAIIDLDHPPRWFSNQADEHLSADSARLFANTSGPVKILTNPISAGYVQNPISVYYCYCSDEAQTLDKCIAEVTNTPWGDRVRFVFNPRGEDVPKSLHVSPFMDMRGTWRLDAPPPGRSLSLSVRVAHPEHGAFFDAHLAAKRADGPSLRLRNEEAGLATLLRYGYAPQRVAVLIYWQALKLVLKGARFFSPPGKALRERLLEPGATTHPAVSSTGCPFQWVDAEEYPWRTE